MTVPRQTFDVAISEQLRTTILDILAKFPEARAIAAIVDYHGSLNDADVNKGVWIGENGDHKTLTEVFGGIAQTLRMLDLQIGVANTLYSRFRENMTVLGTEIVRQHAEIKALEETILARRAELAALGTPAAQTSS